MPFTVSHAAAAAPLRWILRERAVVSALICGAMAPDMEYFVHMGPVRTISHTFHGLFLLDAPVGLVMLWLLHRFLKRPFALLLPEPLARRVYAEAHRPFAWGPPERFAAILFSLWIGGASHLLWDAFTHEKSGLVAAWPILRATVYTFGGHDFPVWSFLQNLSSVVGLAVLVLWAARALAERAPAPPPIRDRVPAGTKALAWAAIACTGAAFGVARAWPYRAGPWPQWAHDFSVHFVIATMTGTIAAGLVAAAFTLGFYPPPGEATGEGSAAVPVSEEVEPS